MNDSSPERDPSAAPVTRFEVETTIPTTHGAFRVRAYTTTMGDSGPDLTNLAIVAGEVADGALVRVHSECITGEAFHSLKCECGPQLDAALDRIHAEGGVVLYLRGHEGRGIGLLNKLRAYALQEQGLDTVDANTALGLPADARDYSSAAAMLDDLGLPRIRLLTNNPTKQHALEYYGIEVVERIPLVVGRNDVNAAYLDTKAARMGHRYEPDVISGHDTHTGTGSHAI
ncbi:hypothetical protein GCM10011490_21120 [Pseudoclavibacter endophyticus]|uniref:GTP cyclohydrolase-2 n=1 Tax=Pseudoclavibacter endophyticus TaxID=1778590 RepID=A0A6H9WBW7_9MICO|nr:GTP cyclohydrolase II [Pseudoclavibacter endophyticus]GGA70248.1 hypothetical protein GCM10011490_21120 [Pseudoclavibacter endophyticus]